MKYIKCVNTHAEHGCLQSALFPIHPLALQTHTDNKGVYNYTEADADMENVQINKIYLDK